MTKRDALPDQAHAAAFDPPREVHARIDPERFAALHGFAREALAGLPLHEEAAALGLDPAACLDAVSQATLTTTQAERVFEPFEGEWLGGDLHDSRRVYRHVWYPSECEPDFVGQKVLMLRMDGQATLAYDFCPLEPTPEIRGLVGDRAHVGFALPEGALLWLGEESGSQVSVHLERVRHDGALYDIRGVIARWDGAAGTVTGRSDWRYHRLLPGAVAATV
jgi:hypothetical protein